MPTTIASKRAAKESSSVAGNESARSSATARRVRALLAYRGEVRPIHRAPYEPLHVRAQAEGFGRLIEDHVRAVVEHVVGDLLVRGGSLRRVRDERGRATFVGDLVVPAVA